MCSSIYRLNATVSVTSVTGTRALAPPLVLPLVRVAYGVQVARDVIQQVTWYGVFVAEVTGFVD